MHLSKDFFTNERGIKTYGHICLPKKRGWSPIIKNAYVSSLSQEHGIMKADEAPLRSVQAGDVLMVLPVHSCLTMDSMREFLTFDGRRLQTMRKFC